MFTKGLAHYRRAFCHFDNGVSIYMVVFGSERCNFGRIPALAQLVIVTACMFKILSV